MDEKSKHEIALYLTAQKPDPLKGAELYFKHGRNTALRRLFINSPTRYLSKMRWELSKLIGISLNDFQHGIFDSSGEAEIRRRYPPVIERLKNDLPEMYKKRVMLQKELTQMSQTNAIDEKEHAAQLASEISELAQRYQVLYNAKESFFNDGIIPDEKELYPKEENEKPLSDIDPDVLMREKKNLRSSITKDRNKLKYQNAKKLPEENPMPKGKARTQIIERLARKKARLKAINDYLSSHTAG